MGDNNAAQTLSSSGNSPATNPLGSGTTSNTKLAFKSISSFNPTFYRAWASDVQDAFAESEWINYLIPPSDRQFERNPNHYSTSERLVVYQILCGKLWVRFPTKKKTTTTSPHKILNHDYYFILHSSGKTDNLTR